MDDQQNQDGQAALQEKLVLVLRRPIAVGGKNYEKLTLREPLAGELEIASRTQTGVGGLMALISAIGAVPIDVPQAMLSRDLAAVDAFFNTFSVPPADLGEGDDFVDEMTLILRKPVNIGKGDNAVVLEQLELVEPNGGQKDKASREPNDMRSAIALIAAVAKVPRLAVERMCRRDFEEACNFLASCNVAGPTTGATSPRS